jgi:hypothetical protein
MLFHFLLFFFSFCAFLHFPSHLSIELLHCVQKFFPLSQNTQTLSLSWLLIWILIDAQDEQEEQDFAEDKNSSLLSDSKKSKSSSHSEAYEIITEGNQELGFASGAQQSSHILGSVVSTCKH